YTTRMGSGPRRAHVNYQCPCGCIGGVIYSADKPLSKAGACCCGRKLWVGQQAEERIRPYLEAGIDYEWDIGSVTLPWGEVAETAMAWPKGSETAHLPGPQEGGQRVRDVVCGMTIDPARAAATSLYRNETFYFCAPACKQRFDAEPAKFAPARGLLDRLRRR
ncbi:MAG TPA: YHS domain-containing protein, partial [Dehalococcoidia bacterium]|nr:YHS domain-containing protein [Dehalococcoidia bacterium]